MDVDFGGSLNAEEVAKHFGESENFNFKDLELLFKLKDSKGQGEIDFMDFCKWMGAVIKPCEGFYFRHDSVKNPGFDKFQKRAKNASVNERKQST